MMIQTCIDNLSKKNSGKKKKKKLTIYAFILSRVGFYGFFT